MARIPLVPLDLKEPEALVSAIRKRRGGELSDLDRLLLQSPALAEGWNTFLGAVRQRLSLAPKLREIVMCSVAVLNGAEYEFFHHAPEFIKAGGTQAQVDAMQDVDAALDNTAAFDELERAVLRLTYEMTKQVSVNAATLEKARSLLGNEQAAVELVATIAAYNMVSRVVVACAISPEMRYAKK